MVQWGAIDVLPGRRYKLTFWAKTVAGGSGRLGDALVWISSGNDGTGILYGQREFTGVSTSWQQFTMDIPPVDRPYIFLQIEDNPLSGSGDFSLFLDDVSLTAE
jgi:hypothetical protein